MVFIYRAVVIALVIFVSALAGFGVGGLLSADYVAASKGMVGSVVGLDATLLAIVLGLLIWTAHGQFTAQVAQLQTIGRALILLDLALAGYGPEATAAREAARSLLAKVLDRLWVADARERRTADYAHLADVVLPMRDAIHALRPADDDQKQHMAAAQEQFGTIADTHVTMMRSLVNPVPNLLLTIVVGWACLLFFGYALTAPDNLLTLIMAGLGALSVASAAYLILELSDPYVGLFRLPVNAFEGLMKSLAPTGPGSGESNEVWPSRV